MTQTRSLSEFSRLSEYTRLYPIILINKRSSSYSTCVQSVHKIVNINGNVQKSAIKHEVLYFWNNTYLCASVICKSHMRQGTDKNGSVKLTYGVHVAACAHLEYAFMRYDTYHYLINKPKYSFWRHLSVLLAYSKTCVKRPLKYRQNKDLNDK